MTKRSLIATVGLTAALMLVTAQAAAASTEVGNKCIGNTSASGITIVGTANGPGNPLPATVPSAGVVTRWTFNVVPIPSGILSQSLKIMRPTGVAKQLKVVGESPQSPIVSGLNTFSTRIPVQAGDLLATYGTTTTEPVTVFCETGNEGDRVGAVLGNPATGSTAIVAEEVNKLQIPVTAVIEPDADGDGYGDETQDKCPQSAAVQGECPKVKIDIGSVVKKKGSVVVALTATNEASVNVTGVVKLGKGKKAKLSSGKHVVKPGKITRFTLKFTSKLKAALADLPKGKSLSLKVTASAKDLIGRVTKDQVKAKLKGQG